MFDLPLFPLHNVLFPGMALPLHVFESRYKQMIKFCLEGDKRFGVVLIRHGSEALGPLPEPHLIGCTAQIIEVQPLEEGHMYLTTTGVQRFRINTINHGLPYLVGKVEILPFEGNDPQELITAAAGPGPTLPTQEEFRFPSRRERGGPRPGGSPVGPSPTRGLRFP